MYALRCAGAQALLFLELEVRILREVLVRFQLKQLYFVYNNKTNNIINDNNSNSNHRIRNFLYSNARVCHLRDATRIRSRS